MAQEGDKVEKGIRFGCGSIFGFLLVFVGGATLLAPFESLLYPIVIVSCLSGLTFGVLAFLYGDSFWHKLKDWLWFWPL